MYGNVGMLAWMLCYILVLLGLSFYGLHRDLMLFPYFGDRKSTLLHLALFTELSMVTVQLPVNNERYVLKQILQTIIRIDYPKENPQIQVLDDLTDETSEIAAIE